MTQHSFAGGALSAGGALAAAGEAPPFGGTHAVIVAAAAAVTISCNLQY